MSLLYGDLKRPKRNVIVRNIIATDKLIAYCYSMNSLIADCISSKDYDIAISLLRTEIEAIQRNIDYENNVMTK